ncbi:MAG: hypothetical protein R3F43_30075 [bacterium]
MIERFGQNLERLPPPAGLPPETAKLMSQSLQTAAQSVRQAAVHWYQQAVALADRSGVTGEWPDFARQRLAALGKP